MSFQSLPAAVDIGQPVTVTINCVVGQTPTNPTTLYVSYDAINPITQVEVLAETTWQYGVSGNITNPSVGTFVVTVTPTVGGLYRVRVVGTAACAFAQNGTFNVNSSALTPP